MKVFLKFFTVSIFIASVLLFPINSFSKTVEYDLIIEKKEIHIHGRTSDGMTINGFIPGPTLRFKDGDLARIRVNNKMNTDTSIHWHGLLVPPEMDGVPNISFPPIKPGYTFVYEFPIRQDGTYWYHSHTHLQEQQGLYGSIVITPRSNSKRTDQDKVLLLSDWTTESPDTVIRTLKSGSEWYALQKGSSQSILGAAAQGELGAYFTRELQRMPPMDIADVAYDFFLVNGSPQISIPADSKETMRLRIINGSATSYFYLEFAGGDMQIVSADGQEVEPLRQKRFLIGVAETYDLIIKIPGPGSYEFRATAHDGSGYSSTWIGSGEIFSAPDIPKPNLYATMDHGDMTSAFSFTPQGVMGMPDSKVEMGMFDMPGMVGMDHDKGMNHYTDMEHNKNINIEHIDSMKSMNHSSHGSTHGTQKETDLPMLMNDMKKKKDNARHKMVQPDIQAVKPGNMHTFDYGFLGTDISSSRSLAIDGTSPERPWPLYPKLRSKTSTALPKNRPVKELRFTLDGDMERYVWFLNNKPLSETDQILIREGEIVRFIMINRTMMHHPMHLHGHFFRVVNGQGDHAPLKHTVNVAPMSTTVIEFNANEVGDWFFHCHLLYHMKSGMARKFHYENYEPSDEVKKISSNLFKDPWYLWGEADILSHMTEGFFKLANTKNTIELDWEAGWQDVDATLWEGSLTLDRYINRFFSVFAGGFMEGENGHEEKTKAIFGFHYLLPLNIESQTWIDNEGEARASLEKEFELTPRLAVGLETQYDTKEDWENAISLSYILYKQISLTVKWHSEYSWGAGITFQF